MSIRDDSKTMHSRFHTTLNSSGSKNRSYIETPYKVVSRPNEKYNYFDPLLLPKLIKPLANHKDFSTINSKKEVCRAKVYNWQINSTINYGSPASDIKSKRNKELSARRHDRSRLRSNYEYLL